MEKCFLYHDSVLEVLSPGISKYIDFENDRHADKWFNNNLEQIRKISISVDWDESNRNFWKSS